jgi:hypothetical protein
MILSQGIPVRSRRLRAMSAISYPYTLGPSQIGVDLSGVYPNGPRPRPVFASDGQKSSQIGVHFREQALIGVGFRVLPLWHFRVLCGKSFWVFSLAAVARDQRIRMSKITTPRHTSAQSGILNSTICSPKRQAKTAGVISFPFFASLQLLIYRPAGQVIRRWAIRCKWDSAC